MDENISNGMEERRSIARRLESLQVLVARLDERIRLADVANSVAKVEVDRRLAEMNEMRTQIAGERMNYLDRKEYEVKHEILDTKIQDTQKYVWMGLGGLFVFQLLGALVLHYWHGP